MHNKTSDITLHDLAVLITGVSKDVRALTARLDGLETRFDGLEVRFDNLETRFDGLEKRFDGLEKEVHAMRTDITQMIDEQNERMEALERRMNDRFEIFGERLFSLEEKEELLGNVRHYNQWLLEDATGARRITLMRNEYDSTQKTAGFPHRFSQ